MFNLLKPKILPTPIVDYSRVIEVGDTIGFMYAGECYHEGIIEVILKNCGNVLCEDEDIKYVIQITRDDSPRYFSNWVGRSKVVDMKYRQWTMIKKHLSVEDIEENK